MALSPEKLKAVGAYTHTEAKANAFARVLLLGPAKGGKTTVLTKTAPGPRLVLNCDGDGAVMGAVNQGAEFIALDVSNRVSLKQATRTACELADTGEIRSIILDSASLLCDFLLDDIGVLLDGWDKWNELEAAMMGACKQLISSPAHLFVTAHMTAGSDTSEGILPAIGGKTKWKLPALLDDWVLLDVDPERNPERMFLLGPQRAWTHSGRNVRRTCAIDADCNELLAELGITP
jgi:hypothetical protein